MKQELLKKLEQKKNKKVKEAAEKLLNSNVVDYELDSQIKWIETSAKLLENAKGHPLSGFIVAVAIVLLCLLAGGLLWVIRIPQANVAVSITSKTLNLQLWEKWMLDEPFEIDYIRIENIQTIHALGLGINVDNNNAPGSLKLEAEGGDIVLEKLILGKNGTVEMEMMAKQLVLSLKETEMYGSFAVTDTNSFSINGRKNEKGKKTKYPESIEFGVSRKGKIPTHIVLGLKAPATIPLKFNHMKVKKIDFLKETLSAIGNYSFESTVSGGEVKLFDVPVTEKIFKKDLIFLEVLQLEHLNISFKDQLYVYLDGKVRHLTIGPKGFERNLAPTCLEYLYHQERLGFFWSAVLFFWGILWGVRRLIFAGK